MAKQASKSMRVIEYHVYDPTVTSLGGVPVINRGDGGRVIPLTQQQAQFYITGGVIGTYPESQLSDETRATLRMFRGQKA